MRIFWILFFLAVVAVELRSEKGRNSTAHTQVNAASSSNPAKLLERQNKTSHPEVGLSHNKDGTSLILGALPWDRASSFFFSTLQKHLCVINIFYHKKN